MQRCKALVKKKVLKFISRCQQSSVKKKVFNTNTKKDNFSSLTERKKEKCSMTYGGQVARYVLC